MKIHSIKYKDLDENIPKDSELYDYLSHKSETMDQSNYERYNYMGKQTLKKYRDPYKSPPKSLLIMPPITLSTGTVKRVIPPLGLAYIGGVMEREGLDFEILDCVAEGLDIEKEISEGMWVYGLDDLTIENRIREYNPEIVAISIIYSSDLNSLYNIARIAKKVNNDVVVVAGGIHCTIYPREVLQESNNNGLPIIDFIIRGEGEYRFVDFLKNINTGSIDINADGLCGYYNDQRFINNQITRIEDLDALPLPAYHKLPMEKYFQFNVPFSPFPRGKRVMQIYTSRGCPIGCTFCASTNFNKKYIARSPENVANEIKYYIDKYNIDEIQFADDNLTFSKSRSIELFCLLEELNIQWCTPNGIMINTLTDELLKTMVLSGLYQITLSIDSGSEKVLKEDHRKPVKLRFLPDLINYLKENKILIHGTVVIGMPNETIEDIDDGLKFISNLELDSVGVFIAQALPGSELYETAVESMLMTRLSGRIIDTAKSVHTLSKIPKNVLEKKIHDFLYGYNKIIKARNPEKWSIKYDLHKDRLPFITIGKAAPNSDGIIKASQPTPNEIL